MGFWVFMLCMNLLIPAIMILFGAIFMHCPPEDINGFYGYRTSRSMACREAWQFAQRYFGRIWFREGLALLVLCTPAMLPCMGRGKDAVGIWGTVVCVVEGILMLLPIVWTERALKRRGF